MLKRMMLILTILLCFSTAVYCDDPGNAGSAVTEDILETQLDTVDTIEIEQFIEAINKESGGYIPKLDLKSMVMGLFRNNPVNSVQDTIKGLFRFFLKEVVQNLNLMGKIILLAVFCAIMQNLHSAFQGEAVGKLAYNVCYILVIILAIQSFNTALALGNHAIQSMVGFMQALLPTLIALLASVGGIASSALFQPFIFTTIAAVATLVKTVIIPLVLFSAVLSIMNNLSDSIKVSKLASLLRQTAIGLLGVILTVFTGIISVQGIAASSLDGAAVKTAKFAVDNFVPIVGSFLSDAFDAVISCSLILKNGIGVAGLLILLLICSFPLLKMLSIIVIYKLSSALIEPILDNQIVQCLNDMSNAMLILMTCVIAVGVMFFMALTVIMGVGNMTVMLR